MEAIQINATYSRLMIWGARVGNPALPSLLYKGEEMKLEKQATSLELSKELKEAGYPQEGLWRWQHIWKARLQRNTKHKAYEEQFYFIAPTVAELGEVLPVNTRFIKRGKGWNNRDNIHYEVEDWNGNLETDCCLPNALAKMWLYLIKEKK